VVPTLPHLAQPEEVVDGRNRRRINSFDRAVDALLDLIDSGNPSPTAQDIAERSGISVRTVFRLTEDIESLHAAAVRRQMERTAHLYVELPNRGSVTTRARALVKNRSAVFETIAPIRRVGDRLGTASPQIADGLQLHHLVLRMQIEQLFAAELQAMSPVRRQTVTTALDVAASWETWDQLRRLKGLSVADSVRVMNILVAAALSS
jgi:TetR/AcrR family transcriptional regulator, regulator of autoinduction and epiphytic fitness